MKEQPQQSLGESLDPAIGRIFTPLCQTLSTLDAATLNQTLSDHGAVLHQAVETNEFLDIDLAVQISQALAQLFDAYETYSAENQALIIGCARYFIATDDAEHDTDSVLGLDDDVAVLNYVVDKLQRTDLHIHL